MLTFPLRALYLANENEDMIILTKNDNRLYKVGTEKYDTVTYDIYQISILVEL